MKRIFPTQLRIIIAWCLIVSFFQLATACSYYKIKPREIAGDEGVYIITKEKLEKYIIVHFSVQAVHLYDADWDKDNNVISGKIESLSQFHRAYKKVRGNKINRFRSLKESPGNEIHIYVSKVLKQNDKDLSFRVGDISDTREFKKAPAVSVAIALPVIVIGCIVLISAAMFLNDPCPEC